MPAINAKAFLSARARRIGQFLTGKDLAEVDLKSGSVDRLIVTLRRRSAVCRRTSWIFLSSIIAILLLAGYVTWGLLANVQSVETKILADFNAQTRGQIDRFNEQISTHEKRLEAAKPSLRRFITGVGVEWETMEPEKPSSAVTFLEIGESDQGDPLLLVELTDGFVVYRGEENGARWVKGEEIKSSSYSDPWVSISGSQILLEFESYDDETGVVSYVSDNLGATFKRAPSPDIAVDLESCPVEWSDTYVSDAYTLVGVDCEESTTELFLYSSEDGRRLALEGNETLQYLWDTAAVEAEGILFAFYGIASNGDYGVWRILNPVDDVATIEFVEWIGSSPVDSAILGRTVLSMKVVEQDDAAALQLIAIDAVTGNKETLWIDPPATFDAKSWQAIINSHRDGARLPGDYGYAEFSSLGGPLPIIRFYVDDAPLDGALILTRSGTGQLDTKFVEGEFLFNEGPFVLNQSGGKVTVRQIDPRTGDVVRLADAPLQELEHVVGGGRTDDGWVFVESRFQSGARAATIWELRDGETDWTRRPIPRDLSAASIVRWNAWLGGDNSLVLAASDRDQDGGILLVRSESYPTADIDLTAKFRSAAALNQFLDEEAPPIVKQWTGYDSLQETLSSIINFRTVRDQLQEHVDDLENKGAPTDSDADSDGWLSPPPLTDSFASVFTPDVLFISLGRILILGLIFFAARILINLYRYFLRLAAYYEARADGLSLVLAGNPAIKPMLPDHLPMLFDTFSPDGVDLGTPPKSPIHDVVDSATKVAQSAASLAKK